MASRVRAPNIVTADEDARATARERAEEALMRAAQSDGGDRALVMEIERELVDGLLMREDAREATCASATNAKRRKLAGYLAIQHGVEALSVGEGKKERVVWVKPEGWTMEAMGKRIEEYASDATSATSGDASSSGASAVAAVKSPTKVIRVKSKTTNTSPPGDIEALSRGMGAMKVQKEASTQTTEQREEAYRVARERIFGAQGDGNDNAEDASRSNTPRAQSPRLSEAQSNGEGVVVFERNRGKALKKNARADSFDPDFARPRNPRPSAPPLPPGQPLAPPQMPVPMPVPMPMRPGVLLAPGPGLVPVHFPPQYGALGPGMVPMQHFGVPLGMPMPHPIPNAQFAPPSMNPPWTQPQSHVMYHPHQGGDDAPPHRGDS